MHMQTVRLLKLDAFQVRPSDHRLAQDRRGTKRLQRRGGGGGVVGGAQRKEGCLQVSDVISWPYQELAAPLQQFCRWT